MDGLQTSVASLKTAAALSSKKFTDIDGMLAELNSKLSEVKHNMAQLQAAQPVSAAAVSKT